MSSPRAVSLASIAASLLAAATVIALTLLPSCGHAPAPSRRDARARELDELSALWSYYRFTWIDGGRVVAHDEGGITTSEGQSYALLRAVWAGDRETFDAVWRWTRENLQVRGDALLAWRWKDGRVEDANAATDADVDTALALILASRRFSSSTYREQALPILRDVWAKEVVRAGDGWLPTGGNWAPGEKFPTVHVGYLAPNAYEVFARVDPDRPWRELVRSSYDLLHFLYFEQGLRFPPEKVWIDKATGRVLLEHPESRARPDFGYDPVPLFWRVALDARWHGRAEGPLRERMLEPFRDAWRADRRILDRYTTGGKALGAIEGLPHLATVQALALVEDRALARELRQEKLDALFLRALAGEPTPYYLHNWLWLGRALELDATRRFDEVLGFLRPFDWEGFAAAFPWMPFAAALALYPLARRWRLARAAFLAAGLSLCVRYLHWRATSTLNFVEPLGPFISISLLLAEAYSLTTVALLVVQVGLGPRARRSPSPPPLAEAEPHPSVDVLVPIYSESLDILDKTLAAAAAMRWPDKKLWVCDDSHRDEVAALAREHGAGYFRGPKKHAKAGNLNAAMAHTTGELIVVFDTDHIPVETFLERTVPHFRDPKVGMVQTPHHFYNQDIFQRAFGAGARVPNEQDMFNHAIQSGRDGWGGSFFVGSGAVFRRAAIASVGGFNLLSITEDIHTCQQLHAKGWRSAFVDEDLAVGLAAENLSSYLVQRRRWMLGCLQIFFKDNPLLTRGLPLRHRVAYFASLWYFFFPLARVVFWATPAWFLLFHLHPLFADVAELLALLLPGMILLPLMSAVLVPGWPRAFWGVVYECAVAFPLLRAMVDLVLPKRLGFKVTPKGIVSERRAFDLGSTGLTLAAAAVTAVAVAKGYFELEYFGIEKDAYFFNLGWGVYNLLVLAAALLVAWERPQRRSEERVSRALPARVAAADGWREVVTREIGLGGLSFELDRDPRLARSVEVELGGVPARASTSERPACASGEREPRASSLSLRARVVYCEPVRSGRLKRERRWRCGLAFTGVTSEDRRALVRLVFGQAEAWAGAHDRRPRTAVGMGLAFVRGLAACFAPLRAMRRRSARRRTLRALTLVWEGRGCLALVHEEGPRGLGLLLLGAEPPRDALLPVLSADGSAQWARVAHVRRVAPLLFRGGLELLGPAERPAGARPIRAWIAA